MESGEDRTVELLLAQGDVDVNSRDTYGATPLSRAAEFGHARIVELLLGQNADANLPRKKNRTPSRWRRKLAICR